MQELGVYKDFELQGVIKAYKGLTWVRKFNDTGDFTLTLAATKENIELIKSGNIIVKGTEAAFIENMDGTQESNKKVEFAVTGRPLSKMLNQRVVTLTMSGNTSTVIEAILRQNFTAAADANRNIPNFVIKNMDIKNALPVKVEWAGKNALDCIRELAQNAIVGFKVDLNLKDKALFRANITTISALRETNDFKLSRVRNIGAKCIAEIDAAIPDRIRTYEGEAEEHEAYRMRHKIDSNARRIMRFMESQNMTLSELMKSGFRLPGKRKARQLLMEYCTVFPERIADVLEHFEAMNDTSDKFYKSLNSTWRE